MIIKARINRGMYEGMTGDVVELDSEFAVVRFGQHQKALTFYADDVTVIDFKETVH